MNPLTASQGVALASLVFEAGAPNTIGGLAAHMERGARRDGPQSQYGKVAALLRQAEALAREFR